VNGQTRRSSRSIGSRYINACAFAESKLLLCRTEATNAEKSRIDAQYPPEPTRGLPTSTRLVMMPLQIRAEKRRASVKVESSRRGTCVTTLLPNDVQLQECRVNRLLSHPLIRRNVFQNIIAIRFNNLRNHNVKAFVPLLISTLGFQMFRVR
jgi:hypothetical protein